MKNIISISLLLGLMSLTAQALAAQDVNSPNFNSPNMEIKTNRIHTPQEMLEENKPQLEQLLKDALKNKVSNLDSEISNLDSHIDKENEELTKMKIKYKELTEKHNTLIQNIGISDKQKSIENLIEKKYKIISQMFDIKLAIIKRESDFALQKNSIPLEVTKQPASEHQSKNSLIMTCKKLFKRYKNRYF